MSQPISGSGDTYLSIFAFLNPIRFEKICSYKFQFYTFYYRGVNDYFAIRLRNSSSNYRYVYEKEILGNTDKSWNFTTVELQPDEYFKKDLIVKKNN
jgi:hypothetical protein